ncbi:MAG: hypothetical protein AAGF95_23200 [Chloroflexota bacterium]
MSRVLVAWFACMLITFSACSNMLPNTPENRGFAMQSSQSLPLNRGITAQAEQITLTADDFYLEADRKRYTAQVHPILLNSYTDHEYGKLELTWFEHGVEMRLYLYFTGNSTSWWVNEIRTFDGSSPGDWIYYRGVFFKSPKGQPFTGDFDISSQDMPQYRSDAVPGKLHFTNLRLECNCSFQPEPKKHMP